MGKLHLIKTVLGKDAPSVIVHGPAGCGKTLNASRIARHFGLIYTVDGWASGQTFQPKNFLYLTNEDMDLFAKAQKQIKVVAYSSLPKRVIGVNQNG